MRKTLIFAMMIGFLTAANDQAADNDTSAVQDKNRIAVFKNKIYAYGQYSISALVNAGNAAALAYDNDTNTKWSAEVDFIRTDLRWYAHMAYEWTYEYALIDKKPFKNDPGNYRLDYGSTYTPIVAVMPTNIKPKINLRYTKSQWSAGIRGRYFNESVQRSGIVESIGKTIQGDTTYFSITGIRGWDHSLFPLPNILEPSGFTKVPWWTGNAVRLITAEAYALYSVNSTFDFIVALKAIDMENKQIIGQKHWAYVIAMGGRVWDNDVTLNQTASVKYRAVGPMIGFNFHTGPLEVQYQAGTLSSNNVFDDAQWDDVDKIDYWKSDSVTLWYDVLYNGDFSYSHKRRADIPLTELQIKLNTPDLDPVKGATTTFNVLTRLSSRFQWLSKKFNGVERISSRFEDKVYFQFGLGWHQSVFKDAPIAPQWTVPGDWTLAKGSHWQLRTQDLVFQGISVSVALKLKL